MYEVILNQARLAYNSVVENFEGFTIYRSTTAFQADLDTFFLDSLDIYKEESFELFSSSFGLEKIEGTPYETLHIKDYLDTNYDLSLSTMVLAIDDMLLADRDKVDLMVATLILSQVKNFKLDKQKEVNGLEYGYFTYNEEIECVIEGMKDGFTRLIVDGDEMCQYSHFGKMVVWFVLSFLLHHETIDEALVDDSFGFPYVAYQYLVVVGRLLVNCTPREGVSFNDYVYACIDDALSFGEVE